MVVSSSRVISVLTGAALLQAPSFAQPAFAKEEAPRPKSVYYVNPAVTGGAIALTTGGTLWAYLDSEHLIHPRCPCDPNEVNGLDRGAIGHANDFLDATSDVTAAVAVAFPVFLDGMEVGWSREFAEDMAVYAETLSINGALVTLAKYTVQRPLPRTYAGDPGLVSRPGGYRSFYSGHTSVVVSALSSASMTYTYRHPEAWWPWLLTGAVGTAVALERVAAGRHFYSDVAVGALAGAIVGVTVPMLHHRREGGTQLLAFVPTGDGGVLLWRSRF